jgi:hypothetical protein
LTLQIRDLKRAASAQVVAFRQDSQETHWIQRPSFEAGIARRHDSHFNFAAIQQAPQLSPARFLQFNLDERMPAFIPSKKICQKTLNHLGRGADAKQTSLPCLQGSCPLTQRAKFCQQTAAMCEQVLPL